MATAEPNVAWCRVSQDAWVSTIGLLLDPTSTPAVKKKKNLFKRVAKQLGRA